MHFENTHHTIILNFDHSSCHREMPDWDLSIFARKMMGYSSNTAALGLPWVVSVAIAQISQVYHNFNSNWGTVKFSSEHDLYCSSFGRGNFQLLITQFWISAVNESELRRSRDWVRRSSVATWLQKVLASWCRRSNSRVPSSNRENLNS